MTTIQEDLLQIKDKNVKWENTMEEVDLKKNKIKVKGCETVYH